MARSQLKGALVRSHSSFDGMVNKFPKDSSSWTPSKWRHKKPDDQQVLQPCSSSSWVWFEKLDHQAPGWKMKHFSNHHLEETKAQSTVLQPLQDLSKKTYPDLSNFRVNWCKKRSFSRVLGTWSQIPQATSSEAWEYLGTRDICQLNCSDILVDESWI